MGKGHEVESTRPLYLTFGVVASFALLTGGATVTSALLDAPASFIFGGTMATCALALAVFLAWEWSSFREQNKRYISEITDLNLRFGILADAVSAVSSTLDIEELVENILGVMLTLTGSEVGVVLVPDETRQHLKVISFRGFHPKAVKGLKIPASKGAVGQAFQSGKAMVRKNLPLDPKANRVYTSGKPPRSQVILPLKAKGQVVGVAITASSEDKDYSPEEISLLTSLAHELAVAMINVELYQQSQKTLEWLADTQQYTDNFIREMLAGALVVNESEEVIYFNREATEILELQPHEVIGLKLEDLERKGEKFKALSFIPSVLRLCMGEDRVFRRHEIAVNVNGKTRIINFNAFPLHRKSGEMMGAAVIFTDVTAVRELEAKLRQQDHLAILGQMSAKIAHEVKNPLFAILGLAEELEAEESDPEKLRLIRMIREEANLGNQWISGVLAFSRSPSPPGTEAVTVDPSELISRLVDDFRRSLATTGIEVEEYIEPGLPSVMAGKESFRHILFNLMDNAQQAMPEGGIITVRARRLGDGHLEIRVEDTGKGIDEEALPHIFEPFFTTREGGTGLGLSIVQKIVTDMGGRVEVSTWRGKGTVFSVKIPSSLMGVKEVG